MLANAGSCLSGKGGRVLGLISLCFPAALIWILWYAVNSDRDDVHPILNQLIPAGHCACQTATIFECSSCLEPTPEFVANATEVEPWKYEYGRDDRNAGLPEQQCWTSFPGLFEDISRGARYWKENGGISRQALDSVKLVAGMTRAMIFDGDLYVVSTKSKGEDHRRKILATLSAMHRALAAAPDRRSMPNVEFIYSVEDKASDVTGIGDPMWVFARRASEASLFLMPDFGYWAWDNVIDGKNNEIGAYEDVVEKVRDLESELDFSQKEDKLVWRGKLSFAPKLRRALLNVARAHDWSAVKELNWRVKRNFLTLEDHCRFRYIAHVEGRSYSASLKYRQACRSVIIAHKLQYIQHHHYLLSSHGSTQNYVEVERDFEDLPAKMEHLLANPAEAERIADNSVKTFRERYLTLAAEACYWRNLWGGYASIAEKPELWTEADGKRMPRQCVCYNKYYGVDRKHLVDAIAGACSFFSTLTLGPAESKYTHFAQYPHTYATGIFVVTKPQGEEGKVSVQLEWMGGKDGNPNTCVPGMIIPEEFCALNFQWPFDLCNTGGENGKQGGYRNDFCLRWTVDPNPAHNEPDLVLLPQHAESCKNYVEDLGWYASIKAFSSFILSWNY
nr:hypothetical protein B0A51_08069 [Rachicladosporium sp. CCFEE 5018]